MIKPWPLISSRPVGDFRIFTLRSDIRVSPRTGREHDFYVINCVNWVNVIALTPDNNLVMIHQFRHGSNTVELEIPGGMMDPHETDAVATAVRELREETGYEGENARIIGQIFPNPAIMSNICYTILIENCQLRHQVEFDQGEDLATQIVPLADIPSRMRSGQIGHALVAVALYHFELFRREQATPAKS